MQRLLSRLPLLAPLLLPLLLGTGCGLDVVGVWQIERITVDGVAIEDVGFLDIRTNGDVSAGTPNAWLSRYWWDPDAGTWVPDPTPFVETASFDVFRFQDDPGEAELRLDFPYGPDGDDPVGFEQATFLPENPKASRWELSDPDWVHGPMTWELVR